MFLLFQKRLFRYRTFKSTFIGSFGQKKGRIRKFQIFDNKPWTNPSVKVCNLFKFMFLLFQIGYLQYYRTSINTFGSFGQKRKDNKLSKFFQETVEELPQKNANFATFLSSYLQWGGALRLSCGSFGENRKNEEISKFRQKTID